MTFANRDLCTFLQTLAHAITSTALALLAEDPGFDYGYAYQKPSNCLEFLRLNDPEDEWEMVGDHVYTDRSEAVGVYIARITDTEKFPPLFTQALVLLLAYKLATPLQQARTLKEEMHKGFTVALDDAMTEDARESNPERDEDNPLADSRR